MVSVQVYVFYDRCLKGTSRSTSGGHIRYQRRAFPQNVIGDGGHDSTYVMADLLSRIFFFKKQLMM
jgi:hypothetical protein